MSMRNEFLAQVREGDYVTLFFGMAIEGTVIQLTDTSVQLQTDKGQPRVALDSIIFFDKVQKEPQAPAPQPEPEPEPEPVVQLTDAQLLQQKLLDAEPMSNEEIANWESVLERLEDSDYSSQLRKGITSIKDSFTQIRKKLPMAKAELSERMHNITAKALMLCKQETDAEWDIYSLLGGMYMLLEDYASAETYYKKAEDNVGVIYAMDRGQKLDEIDGCLDRYLEDPETPDPYIYRLYAESAVRRQDLHAFSTRISALKELRPDEDITEEELQEQVAQERELLCACAACICLEGELDTDWADGYSREEAAKYLGKFQAAVPPAWGGADVDMIRQIAIENADRMVSTIHRFTLDKRFGFINGVPENHYFYIEQVTKDDDLRKLLAYSESASSGLEVSFYLGKPYDATKRPSASDVRLTEKGAAEAAKRLADLEGMSRPVEILQGDLTEYNNKFGRICVGNKQYNVIQSGITDPYLRVYLAVNFRIDVKVAFTPMKDRNGKDIAVNVRSVEPIQVSDYDVRQLLRSKEVRQEELDAWPDVKQRLDNPEVQKIVTEDLYRYPYVMLDPAGADPIQPRPQPIPQPVSQPEPEEQKIQVSPQQVIHVDAGVLPPLEPLPESSVNLFRNLQPLSGTFYDDAHKLLVKGQTEQAEELYIKALRANDRIESSIADLVTLYLRDADRVPDAIDLMEAFGGYLPEEKRLNMELQIYQKRSERPYRIKLCHLVEQVLAKPFKINAKLHYLGIQASALRELGEFDKAMNSYRRWRQTYESEVQYRGQSAAAQFSKALNYVKRGEAMCYYLQGNRAQAELLARELLRVSSTDEVAHHIIRGTLEQTLSLTKQRQQESEVFVPLDDEARNLDSARVSAYAHSRMKAIDLNKYLKTRAVEDGQYIGDPKKAADDIKFLRDAQGKTPSTRSEMLLCIAKIVLSVQDRFGDDQTAEANLRKLQLTEGDQKKYIARAMASQGDALLESQKEQDVARYAYLQAIEMLAERETDWQKSLNHYIHSYFNGQQEMAQLVRSANQSSQSKNADMTVISQNRPQDVGEFAVGMLQLRRALEKSNSTMRFQLSEVLRRCRSIDELAAWLEARQIPVSCANMDAFSNVINQAENKLRNAEQILQEYMELLPSQILSRYNSEDLLQKLQDPELYHWLGYTDRKRLERICQIMGEFRSYFTIHEFQNRSGMLSTAIMQLGNLIDEISEYPTRLSYDVILEALDQTRSCLHEAREEHYRNLPPDVSICLTEEVLPYLASNNEVHVHLTVRNGSTQSRGAERQLADNISLEVVSLSRGVEYLRTETDTTGVVYGGKEIEAILVFRVADESLLTMGSFDLTVQCNYRYNERPTQSKLDSVIFNDPIVFHQGQHTRIDNPFHKYIGHEMEDEQMFYGRKETIDKLIRTMTVEGRLNYGHGILLYGQTRAGKSSIRVHFVKRVRKEFPNVILVDMQNLNGNSLTEFSFYYTLLDKLSAELRDNHPDVLQQMQEREIESPIRRMEQMQEYALLLFSRHMDQLYSVIKPMGKMILLVADEFSAINTAIKEGRLPQSFMQTWKALLENHGIFAVCFGQDDTPLFARMNQNAFGRMDQEKVTYLAEGPAKELMDKPISILQEDGSLKSRYTPAALDELYELTSGSAFLIIKVCDLLVEYLNNKGAATVTPGILQNFLSTGVFSGSSCINEQDFEPQLGDRADASLYEINRTLLLDIARNSQVNGMAKIASLSVEGLQPRPDQDPRRRLEELLQRLRERDVIEIEEGTCCRIKVALLSRWLLTQYGRE